MGEFLGPAGVESIRGRGVPPSSFSPKDAPDVGYFEDWENQQTFTEIGKKRE